MINSNEKKNYIIILLILLIIKFIKINENKWNKTIITNLKVLVFIYQTFIFLMQRYISSKLVKVGNSCSIHKKNKNTKFFYKTEKILLKKIPKKSNFYFL